MIEMIEWWALTVTLLTECDVLQKYTSIFWSRQASGLIQPITQQLRLGTNRLGNNFARKGIEVLG